MILENRNQILLLYTFNDSQIPQDHYDAISKLIPESVLLRVNSYIKWQDRQATIFGKILLQKALEFLNLPIKTGNLRTTDFGRPFIRNCPDFNISHTNGLVICAVSELGRVGVDTELVSPIDHQEFKLQFHEEEISEIESANNKTLKFYEIWTRKEAIVKADGRGLQIELNSWSVCNKNSLVLAEKEWRLYSFVMHSTYVVSIACEMDSEITIKKVQIETN